ncbi:MAG: hypothetical protein ACRBF0_01130 [Calditrichia bacterium]
MANITKKEIDELVNNFLNKKLPRSRWTHQAHLIVGTAMYLRYGLEKGVDIMRHRVVQYNVSCGVENTLTSGYHETITVFYMIMISYKLRTVAGAFSEMGKYLHILNSELAKPGILGEFYSNSLLCSEAARTNWVDPDLQQLPHSL